LLASSFEDFRCQDGATPEACAALGCVYNPVSIGYKCVSNSSFTLSGSCRPGDSAPRCILPLVLFATCANATSEAACAAVPYCNFTGGNCTTVLAKGLAALVSAARERGAVVLAVIYEANSECIKGSASAAACQAISFNYTISTPPAASRPPPAAKSPADAATASPSPAPSSSPRNDAGALLRSQLAASLALVLLAILLA
jgi:hypothetical protein